MRYRWIDVYRGISVLFMVALHVFVNIFPAKPLPFLQYSVRGAITIGDMALAMFLFVSGVSSYASLSQRKKVNEDEAINHMAVRYSKIFVLGLLLDIVSIASVNRIWWVLESIGLSGLIAIFFISFSERMKLFAIAVIGICYSYIVSSPGVYSIVSLFPNGGLFGAISLSGIVLFGCMAGEHIMKKKERSLPLFLSAGVFLMLLGFILSYLTVYDRGISTFPYIMFSSGFCLLLAIPVYWLFELRRASSSILEDFGKSALLVFVLNYPVLILAFALNINNSFSNEQTALIALVIILLLAIASKLYVRFTEL